jgi:hypothetical protein
LYFLLALGSTTTIMFTMGSSKTIFFFYVLEFSPKIIRTYFDTTCCTQIHLGAPSTFVSIHAPS